MSGRGGGLRSRLAEIGRSGHAEVDAVERAAAVLQSRREALARRNLAPSRREIVVEAVVVRRGPQLLAVALESAEVVREVELTAFPGCGALLPGLFHLRGRCLCLVDVAAWYGGVEPPLHGSRGLALVVGHGDEQVGLAIDEVVTIRPVYADELAADVERSLPFVGAVAKGGIDVVDVPALLAIPQLRPV